MQKEVFLNNEGDAWFARNHNAIVSRVFDSADPVISAVTRFSSLLPNRGGGRLLEIGCGEGRRLAWLAETMAIECHGIEPSQKAVTVANGLGVTALQGTAESLPYESGFFDIVVFGFCLYLCDRADLFRIASEADRVMKPDGLVIIHDFYSEQPVRREYHHRSGIYSYKMDYRKLFEWHPAYTCFAHEVLHHGNNACTDDLQEWVATSVIRKKTVDA